MNENDLADELKEWLDGFESTDPLPPPSVHHDTLNDMFQEQPKTNAVGPHIDPPAHPYDPYNWAK